MKKPSAATVIATLALFVALGGTSYAAVALAPNSVGTAQIREGAVQSSDIKDGAIGSGDIANGAIGSDDIKSGSIQVSDLTKGALNGLDGKDGAQGPAGPAGPAGARGPAGADGSGGGGSSTSCTWVHKSIATADVHTVCTDSDLVGRNVDQVSYYANFSGSDLTGLFLNGTNAYKANYNNATLVGSTFYGGGPSSFADTTFVQANLTNSTWGNSANLTNADFSGANLTGTTFERADLTGATFDGATLTGVRWMLNENHVSTCPDGTLASANGDTCVNNLTPAPAN